ncbi:MAG: hypothetical protein JWM16_2585 [Verrucomicrobiales bacterium]|nr:hypothetical protein [Verrucomicrobiales bacterium]
MELAIVRTAIERMEGRVGVEPGPRAECERGRGLKPRSTHLEHSTSNAFKVSHLYLMCFFAPPPPRATSAPDGVHGE